MIYLADVPLVVTIAEYIWGDDATEEFSPSICLSSVPFMNQPCWTRLIVKGLGIAIILGAFLNKAPVIANLLNSKSVVGLSKTGVYGDVLMCSNTAIYSFLRGFPITSYGENIALVLQSLVIVIMMWHLDPQTKTKEKIVASVLFVAYMVGSMTMLPEENWFLLMTSVLPVVIISRGSQILETFRVKHTGAQAIITMTMNLGGGSIRILTTLNEIGWDMNVLNGYFLGVSTNFIMFCQYWYYRSNTVTFLKELKDKKKA